MIWDLQSSRHLDGNILAFKALLAHSGSIESASGRAVELAAVKAAVPQQWLRWKC